MNNTGIIPFLIFFSILLIICYVIFFLPNNNENFINKKKSLLNKSDEYCNKNMRCFYTGGRIKKEFNDLKKVLNIYYNKLVNLIDDKKKKQRMINNFKIDNLFEVYPLNVNNDTSYTINKGEELGLCVRSGDDFYNTHELDIIIFVFTHELAHVITLTEQHTDEFWKNFKYLLSLGYKHNLLNLIDFNNNTTKYCGMEIDYNPYLDKTLDIE
tara:strand:+ start:10748 stop:11383 length:636 start_codon:yes stop_codon:yes gene_type:complete